MDVVLIPGKGEKRNVTFTSYHSMEWKMGGGRE